RREGDREAAVRRLVRGGPVTARPRFRSIIGSPLAPATRAVLGAAGVLIVIAAYSYYVHRHELAGGNPRVSPRLGPPWLGPGELTGVAPRTGSVPFWTDPAASLWILARGLAIGIAISAALGIAMGVWSTVHAMAAPVVTALAKVPPTALIALFLVVFGATGD